MSGHWYTKDARACHTQVTASGKNKGKERNTTLRDARKLGLLPSATGVLDLLNKPNLVPWKARKVLTRAFEQPPQPGQSMEAWIAAILQAEEEHQDEHVRDRGSRLHAEIEDFFTSKRGEIVSEDYEFIAPVIEIVESMDSPVLESETVVVNLAEGYAGTADIILASGQVVDFKTKDFKGRDSVHVSFENCCQLAAYFVAANGHAGFLTCRNIYLDRSEPGKVQVKDWTPEELATGWEAFRHLCALWRIMNKYDPRQ